MIFCDRKFCQYNDDGACENPESISLDKNGTCTDYVEYFDRISEYIEEGDEK